MFMQSYCVLKFIGCVGWSMLRSRVQDRGKSLRLDHQTTEVLPRWQQGEKAKSWTTGVLNDFSNCCCSVWGRRPAEGGADCDVLGCSPDYFLNHTEIHRVESFQDSWRHLEFPQLSQMVLCLPVRCVRRETGYLGCRSSASHDFVHIQRHSCPGVVTVLLRLNTRARIQEYREDGALRSSYIQVNSYIRTC